MHKSSHKWQYHSNIIIVNFVKDASLDFSVYKNPYNDCCQISFSLSEYTKVDVRMMEWEGKEEVGEGVEGKERGGKGETRKERAGRGGEGVKNEGGIAPWLFGDRRPWGAGARAPINRLIT